MADRSTSRFVTTAYQLAVILAGGFDSAESIVTAAIAAVPAEDISETTLLIEVARTAWDQPEAAVPAFDAGGGGGCVRVPNALRKLSELPRLHRYCFSMRFLAGLTSHACGSLMGLRSEQVDYFVTRAMLMLAKAAEAKEQRMLAAAC